MAELGRRWRETPARVCPKTREPARLAAVLGGRLTRFLISFPRRAAGFDASSFPIAWPVASKAEAVGDSRSVCQSADAGTAACAGAVVGTARPSPEGLVGT